MRKLKIYMALIVAFCIGTLSCSHKLTTVYYYDNTKLDDGDIGANETHLFFKEDKNVHTYKVRSKLLDKELKKIKNSIKNSPAVKEIDDGFYGYAFITASKDTLFADYKLTYWRSEGKGIIYSNDSLKSIITKATH